MKTMKKYGVDLLFVLILTCIFMWPYMSNDLLAIEHDTFFHLSRIEQLSVSISEGQFLPAVYPYVNNGFGYASPLFYSDLLLIPSALLRLIGLPLSTCYKITVFVITALSMCAMMTLAHCVRKERMFAWLCATAYLFSNYHITDVYVRGALGEVFAMAFMPLLLAGLYKVLYEKEYGYGFLITLGLTGLCLSHNLSFLLGVVLCVILFVLSLKSMKEDTFRCLCKAVGIAFLLTCFYTIPMLEQLKSQQLIVSYYGTSSDLAKGSMKLWQYFVNETIFGYSGNNLEKARTMTVNIGWYLTFIPLLYFIKKEKDEFMTSMMVIGYVFMLLPCALVPWNALKIFSILQFSWRLNMIAFMCLSLVAADALTSLSSKKIITLGCILLLTTEGIYHVLPACERTFGLHSNETWQDVQNGKLCDPYYSATYMRVELAGGDYLPLHSPDFREYSTSIKDYDGYDLSIPYTKEGTTLTFTLPEVSTPKIVLPLTYYKGYQVYRIENGRKVKIDTDATSYGIVSFDNEGSGEYICIYENTLIRSLCLGFSAATCIILMAMKGITKWQKKY